MIKNILAAILLALPLFSFADTPLWLRDIKISPNGQEIAFTYKGDIWKVPAKGGEAVRLTTNSAYETTPIWSPDGKQIAFVSDRNGSFDIFVMPSKGGVPTRLTFNSADEIPETFTPDGKNIIFSASIQDPAESALFPTGRLTEVYQVPVAGGKSTQILATPAQMIVIGKDGKWLYQDVKGMENEWRKHHTSSITREIMQYDPTTGKHVNLTQHAGEDRNPVYGSDGTFYFLSERNGGSMNVYQAPISDPNAAKAVTSFKTHPVRFLSRSNDGTLCYGYDGEIYTQAPGGKPAKVKIEMLPVEDDNIEKWGISKPSEIAASPDGKEIAFVSRGDVFVTSVDYNTTKQITNTPEGEKHVSWGHDSKSLYYTTERDGKYNIYKATLGHEDDPNFANATLINEEAVFKTDKHERTVPKVSPDGKKLAYILDRNILAVRDIESGKTTQLTDGSTHVQRTGEFEYSWSPDSKWIALEIIDRKHEPYTDIAIINVADGTMTNITNSGYFDEAPRWSADGNMIIFASERYGMRNHASWGSMMDVMAVFLNQKAYDNFLLNKEDALLAEEAEKNAKKEEKKNEDKKDDKKKSDKKKGDKDEEDEVEPIVVELERITDRIVRLTPISSELKDATLTDDAERLLFISATQDGNMLWEYKMREGEIGQSKSLSKGQKNIEVTPDGKNIFIFGSNIQKLSPQSLKLTSVSYSGNVKVDLAKEREYMFDNMVREESERFYVADMHGVDWNGLAKSYRKFLPHINNNYDFAEMASELLGELNVSHTGSGYRGDYSKLYENTASLGLLYDLQYVGDGLMVAEVVKKTPFDKKDTKVAAGVVIEKINGQKLTHENDYTILLADLADKKTLVSLYNPTTGERWDEVVKPISRSKMNNLLYDRWVEARAADVDRWSNGRLGYVHIQSMNDASFRKVYSDLLGKYNDREGVVIDIRRNGGGRLHEDIEVLFSGQKYLTQEIRGRETCDMPSRRWNKPSIMVTCEACYSNAHGTPWVYKHQGLGKVVGTPVPGTMTSVNWQTMQDPTLYFGIPVIGYRTAEGHFLENHQLEPDIIVDNDPQLIVIGEDTQLRTAVEELLKELK